VLFVSIFLVRAALLYFGQYLTIKAGAAVIRDLQAELFRGIAHQSLGFFQRHPTGTIVSRVISDVQGLQRVSTIVLADTVRIGATIPALLGTAFYHDWRLSFGATVALPLLGYPMVRLGRRLRRASIASQEHTAEVANRLTEAATGIRVVQAFGMEPFEIERFGAAIQRMLRANLRAGRAQALAPAVMELGSAAVGAAMFYVAGASIARGTLDPGDFAVVVFCLGLLVASIRRANSIYADTQRALASAMRIFDMLDQERRVQDAPGARALAPLARAIRFEDVSFSYGDEPVLRGIELTIEKGQQVALVGPSGSGKSTLANLVLRFHDPTAGRILVDGQDIRLATLESLRAQIGIVTQEPILFDDTVRGCIAYGRADVPLERVIEVARAAQAHPFIDQLPEGYETRIGERGARLSQGERQRLTIARALLKSPPILILDEATSSLDAESEALVQKALEALMQGRTSIVIAHRLSTVRRADRIVVLRDGRIVEQGTHRDLLARGGAYTRLHELQFREPNG
jgi:subfamily B ATP-binding cassette protein MsbA